MIASGDATFTDAIGTVPVVCTCANPDPPLPMNSACAPIRQVEFPHCRFRHPIVVHDIAIDPVMPGRSEGKS
jgi:hypothetical protein